MSAQERVRVVVTVGTDHHPFDRLMSWVDDLVAGGTLQASQVLVQSGTSRPPTAATVRSALPRADLIALMGDAAVVVGHGGPGTIMDARAVGRRPIVVPRVARLGEHVDDHQVAFTRRLADQGKIILAEDLVSFRSAVLRGLEDPAFLTKDEPQTEPATDGAGAAHHVAAVAGGLHDAPPPSTWVRLHELWSARRKASATDRRPLGSYQARSRPR